MGVDLIGFAYAATVAAGGIMGYAKAGSIPSLGAGLIFGSILGVGAYQISRDPSNYSLMLGTTTVLGGLMGYRFYNSRKVMPAGLIFVMSVGMLARLLVKNVGSSSGPMPVKNTNRTYLYMKSALRVACIHCVITPVTQFDCALPLPIAIRF